MTRRAKSKKAKKKIAKQAGRVETQQTPRLRAEPGNHAAARTATVIPAVDPTPIHWYLSVMLLIAAAVVGLYWNTLHNEFLTFDDRKYIYENELVIGDGGLAAIWGDLFNDKPKLHYNPVTYSSYWLEYQAVGPFPDPKEVEGAMGQPAHPLFHVTQMVLHAINACLVLLVLRALGVSFPVAVFTALFFAVHPVNVASVAWVAERKNLLSALFLWSSLLLYVNHRRLTERSLSYKKGAVQWLYLASLAAFVLALGSKAAALILAPVILVTDRLLDRRWSAGALRRAAPYFLLGLLSASIVSAREAFIAKSWEPVAVWARPFIAMAALVHYVTKMMVPVNQAIIYPRWEVSLANPRYWISIVVVLTAAYLIWRYRGWLGDHFLWGLGLFLLTVAPVLGLKHFIWTQFAFVSDHYMYYGSPGVILMIGLLVERWCRPLRRPSADPDAREVRVWIPARTAVVVALSVVALVGCGWRVTEQNRTWRDNPSLWSHTNKIAPDTMVARMNLGNHYLRHDQPEKALEQYKHFARVRPDYVRAWRSCARAARRLERHEEALGYFRRGIEVAEEKNPRAYTLRTEYADYLRSLGRYDEALAEYRILLNRNPPNSEQLRRVVSQLEARLSSEQPQTSDSSSVD